MHIIGFLLNLAIELCVLVIVIQVILSWLIVLGIVNAENDAARNLTAKLKELTDPVYVPLRKYVPPIGGIDITPLIVILGLQLLGSILLPLFY